MPTYQFLGTPSGNTMSTANDYVLGVPGQYTLQDTLNSTQTNPLTGTSGSGSYAFQDTVEFVITQWASGDVMTASLGLPQQPGSGPPTFDITGLQFRLYQVPTGTAPTVGGLPSGATPVTGWMGIPTGQTSVIANFTAIQDGEYFLDIRGTADGTNGGTYVGQLNLGPVPIPAALPLLLSGLGFLGGALHLMRRRAGLMQR